MIKKLLEPDYRLIAMRVRHASRMVNV